MVEILASRSVNQRRTNMTDSRTGLARISSHPPARENVPKEIAKSSRTFIYELLVCRPFVHKPVWIQLVYIRSMVESAESEVLHGSGQRGRMNHYCVAKKSHCSWISGKVSTGLYEKYWIDSRKYLHKKSAEGLWMNWYFAFE